MRRSVFAWLALLSAISAMAATPGFLLGVGYSEWLNESLNGPSPQIATDSSGALYILSSSAYQSPSVVTKLSADGETIVWQNSLGFSALTMAVDPNGGVYVVPFPQPANTSVYVAKLGANGSGIAWKTPIGSGITPAWGGTVAADSQGRAYVAGYYDSMMNVMEVVRLNAAGSAVDYAVQIAGAPLALAVDGSGAAFVIGSTTSPQTTFLARLAPDGSAGFRSVIQEGFRLAVDSNGNAVVLASPTDGSVLLQRFDSTGTVTLSTNVPWEPFGLALDETGNAYVIGAANWLYPVKNTLVTCGADWLSVYAPDGSVLQTTYVPGTGNSDGAFSIAMGPNSTVFLVSGADSTFVPTQAGPFSSGGGGANFFLEELSPNADAQTYPLACIGNSATYSIGPIAPGDFVTLFGNGLGPQQGVLTQASPQSAYPTQMADVQVTFDGTPAPLLWVQDQQINVLAPWSLTPGQTTQVCVSNGTVKTNCLTWRVAQTDPGVFTVDGSFYAAALNQDGTINSANNPAPLNSIVTVFATGLGPITPPQADGTLVGSPVPTNVLPVTVFSEFSSPIAGYEYVNFDVTYAGPAPNFVAGMSEIKFKIVNYPAGIQVSLPSTTSQGFLVYVAGQ